MSSPTPNNIYDALRQFQADMPKVLTSETATVQTKTGGSYTYNYAGLARVTDEVMPALARAGLTFTCWTGFTETGAFVLRYQLAHSTSGDTLPPGGPGAYPIKVSERAQDMGAALSFARRYCLLAVTGVAPEGDDDETAAQSERDATRGTAQRRAPTKRSTAPAEPRGTTAQRAVTEPPPLPGEERTAVRGASNPESGAVQRGLHAMFHTYGVSDQDRGTRLAIISDVIGRPVASQSDLTPAEASRLLTAFGAATDELVGRPIRSARDVTTEDRAMLAQTDPALLTATLHEAYGTPAKKESGS